MIFDWLFPKEKEKAKPPEPKDFVGSLNTRFWDGLHAFPPFELFWQTTILARHFDLTFPYNRLLEEALYKSVFHVYMALPKSLQLTKAEIIRAGEEWEANEWQTKPGLTVPLHDVIDVPNCIMHVMSNFVYDTAMRSGDVATPLRQQLQKNELQAAGVSQYEARTKGLTLLHQHEMEPREHLYAAFKDTPFLEFFNVQVPFKIPRKTWASHGIILAPPNHGKSQLLGALICDFLSDGSRPVGLFVLDPHGDLYNTLRTRVPPDRLVVLDPDTNPPPLNFLDFGTSTEAQTLQTFSYLMSSLSGGLSDKQGAIVPYLLKLLRKIPDASLETLRMIVDEKVKRIEQSAFHQFIVSLPTVDQGFFHNQWYTGDMQKTKDAIGWKLYAALSNETFREMFSAKTNSFDAWEAIQNRKVVLVKGSENTLGEAGAPIFLQFIVAQAMQAAFRRSNLPDDEKHRPLCLLIIDEAKHVFNNQTERILTECRKWNLGFLAASQLISQIPENVRTAIYGATAIKISGPVSDSDAEQLRKEMYCTKEFIRSMASVERSHAEWAIHVSPNKKAMRVRCPYGILEKLPKQKPLDDAQMFQRFKTAIADEAEEIEGKPPISQTPSTANIASSRKSPSNTTNAAPTSNANSLQESVPLPKEDGSWLWDKDEPNEPSKGRP